MLKTLARWLAAAVLILIIAFALFSCESAGWRWLTKGGWHTTARISSLTPQEREWAGIAWRYFENNTQPQTGLVNGSDKQPRVTLWQMGDTLIALLAARELGLIQAAEFDARLTRLLGTLNTPDADRNPHARQTLFQPYGHAHRFHRKTGAARMVGERYGAADAGPASHCRAST